MTAIDPAGTASVLRTVHPGAQPAGARAEGSDSPPGPGGVRACDFEESVRVGRGILLGIGISVLAWGGIVATAAAGWLLIR